MEDTSRFLAPLRNTKAKPALILIPAQVITRTKREDSEKVPPKHTQFNSACLLRTTTSLILSREVVLIHLGRLWHQGMLRDLLLSEIMRYRQTSSY